VWLFCKLLNISMYVYVYCRVKNAGSTKLQQIWQLIINPTKFYLLNFAFHIILTLPMFSTPNIFICQSVKVFYHQGLCILHKYDGGESLTNSYWIINVFPASILFPASIPLNVYQLVKISTIYIWCFICQTWSILPPPKL